MTTEEALEKLGESTAEAVSQVLEMFCGNAPERTPVAVLDGDPAPLAGIPVPAVAANVSYVDGVTGGNIFVMTRTCVQRLAAAMMGQDPHAVEHSDELSELELSAAGEAMNQMMAAAAGATSAVLGEEVEIGVPETRFFASPHDAAEAYELTPHVTSVAFEVFGESCRFVQLVPTAFVMRMTRALRDREEEFSGSAANGGLPPETLRGVPVRVWAELGRTRMPVAHAVGMAPGAVVDLDAAPDEPLQLYVNGRAFATGRLLLVDGEWAVRIERILDES
jgi:flagellar motor switch protein FliN